MCIRDSFWAPRNRFRGNHIQYPWNRPVINGISPWKECTKLRSLVRVWVLNQFNSQCHETSLLAWFEVTQCWALNMLGFNNEHRLWDSTSGSAKEEHRLTDVPKKGCFSNLGYPKCPKLPMLISIEQITNELHCEWESSTPCCPADSRSGPNHGVHRRGWSWSGEFRPWNQ
jgi:hypothetical protein